MSDEALIFLFMPSLVATLLNRERAKGEPLTEEEVIAIRDQAPCVMAPLRAVLEVTAAREYDDIDPEDCWNEWQRLRVEFDEALKTENPHFGQEDQ